jgi:hypothetical protein
MVRAITKAAADEIARGEIAFLLQTIPLPQKSRAEEESCRVS